MSPSLSRAVFFSLEVELEAPVKGETPECFCEVYLSSSLFRFEAFRRSRGEVLVSRLLLAHETLAVYGLSNAGPFEGYFTS